jgi:hypothetical protein
MLRSWYWENEGIVQSKKILPSRGPGGSRRSWPCLLTPCIVGGISLAQKPQAVPVNPITVLDRWLAYMLPAS